MHSAEENTEKPGAEHRRLGINPRNEGLYPVTTASLFGNGNPLVLEIGSGRGRFLLQSAKSEPQRNFVGIEKSLHFYRVLVRRLEHAGLSNVQIINYDAVPVMAEMLPEHSVREIHIYFPDPWPRRREQKRRLIRPEAVEQMHRVLEPGGFGVYVTDHRQYFEASLPVLEGCFDVRQESRNDAFARTNYEVKYRQEGRAIHEVRFFPRKSP
ncbi:MAG: tRNA (guanosine(46)-N7)-methyltransferase TrmB [Acidobacteriota bacterium]